MGFNGQRGANRCGERRRVETFVPTEDTQAAILKAVIGRSGSLRAPTIQSGNIFLVGFNSALYETEVPFT